MEDIELIREEMPLKKWRTSRNLSIQDAAIAVGVTSSAYQRWEKGGQRPTVRHMIILMKLTEDVELPAKWTAWHERLKGAVSNAA